MVLITVHLLVEQTVLVVEEQVWVEQVKHRLLMDQIMVVMVVMVVLSRIGLGLF
jgi:hypothetical protein